MIAHRFRGRNPSIPAFLTETGHRHSNPPPQDEAAPAQSAEPSGQSPPLVVPPAPPPAVSLLAPPLPPKRPMRNAERIATDRQRITDGDVLGILMDNLRGKKELTQTQVNIAFGLLKKILPDFSNSAPPRDDEENREEGPSSDPEFEVHIVDPKAA